MIEVAIWDIRQLLTIIIIDNQYVDIAIDLDAILEYKCDIGIIELFALCKGGNFNIHIWAWFGYFPCKTREIRLYL